MAKYRIVVYLSDFLDPCSRHVADSEDRAYELLERFRSSGYYTWSEGDDWKTWHSPQSIRHITIRKESDNQQGSD